ncbi:MAG: tRNA (adenosine(37)-N6)-threonylcarbamoyltransferase complex ATPase subunit type 1 TsaE [Candidatus Moranbacteria bacterium]|nr:tRNA (adenosine(37)-N6)-threonylcarbamoyltransferase complex ATPase subunit type 1 TsaE [Candidatus Moranbacteria bacterium]
MEHLTHSADETRSLGAAVARDTNPGSILALRGDLGAGKTTFVQGFLEALGAEKPYVSPTFVIMKEYDLAEPSENGIRRIYHVDAYRMDDPEEIEKIGFEEWCADPEGIVLVEWPEKIEPLLPPTTKTISFAWRSDTEREIVF